MPELKDGDDSDDEDALGEAIEHITIIKEKQKCENCGCKNSLQDLYCSSCKHVIAAQGTTPEQRDKRTYDIIKSALDDYGFYWRPLIRRGVPSLKAKTRKEARKKLNAQKSGGAR